MDDARIPVNRSALVLSLQLHAKSIEGFRRLIPCFRRVGKILPFYGLFRHGEAQEAWQILVVTLKRDTGHRRLKRRRYHRFVLRVHLKMVHRLDSGITTRTRYNIIVIGVADLPVKALVIVYM